MSDRLRVLDALREAEDGGVHSHDIRVRGLSGNPSQRIAELEAEGHEITIIRENRGKRPGARYFLTKFLRDTGVAALGGPPSGRRSDSGAAASGPTQARENARGSESLEGQDGGALFSLHEEPKSAALSDWEDEAAA